MSGQRRGDHLDQLWLEDGRVCLGHLLRAAGMRECARAAVRVSVFSVWVVSTQLSAELPDWHRNVANPGGICSDECKICNRGVRGPACAHARVHACCDVIDRATRVRKDGTPIHRNTTIIAIAGFRGPPTGGLRGKMASSRVRFALLPVDYVSFGRRSLVTAGGRLAEPHACPLRVVALLK